MPRKKTPPAETVDSMEQANTLETELFAENEDAAAVPAEETISHVSPDDYAAEPEAADLQDGEQPLPAAEVDLAHVELPSAAEVDPVHVELPSVGTPPPLDEPSGGELAAEPEPLPEPETPPPPPPKPEKPEKSDRQIFYELDFNEVDRGLTPEERQEWNSIYASYRSRSALSGRIIGVDPLAIRVRNRQTGDMEQEVMYCAVVVPYRVRIVIPASEMWESGQERPDFVLQNMVGAAIDFIIIKVDRESGFAIASRRMAARSQRYFFSHRPALHREGAQTKCRVLSVGPRRCLVECYGHDINLTQRELRYTAIPDLRDAYHPGMELDCIVKSYDAGNAALRISVKETESNPFEGAELRHPVGCRRQAVIAGKYGGGVFCNLPDGTVCMCGYSYQHEDADFQVGDTVILVVQRYDIEKRQMYGKILSKW